MVLLRLSTKVRPVPRFVGGLDRVPIRGGRSQGKAHRPDVAAVLKIYLPPYVARRGWSRLPVGVLVAVISKSAGVVVYIGTGVCGTVEGDVALLAENLKALSTIGDYGPFCRDGRHARLEGRPAFGSDRDYGRVEAR